MFLYILSIYGDLSIVDVYSCVYRIKMRMVKHI